MIYSTATIEANEFLRLWHRYEAMKVPDPTKTAVYELLYPARPEILPAARVQLENLVAYWRTHAKPGRALAARKSLFYIDNLRHWRPTGAIQ